eukprot:symbB.v1.2.011294.t1/scaffold735.1/size167969/2
MAPELLCSLEAGLKPDCSLDIFSFGRLSFFVSTGRLPFPHLTIEQVMEAALTADFCDMPWPDLALEETSELQILCKEEICPRCLNRIPANRSTAEETLAVLRSLRPPSPSMPSMPVVPASLTSALHVAEMHSTIGYHSTINASMVAMKRKPFPCDKCTLFYPAELAAARTYMVDIEEDAFSDAGTVGELRKNLLKASSFSFSVYPDTDGPVLATSMPSNNSGDVEPVRDSILLVFDEVVQAVQSDFSVMSTSLVRPMEAPQLDMPPGEIAVNPGVGVITLAFNVDVEAGSGFFHIMVLSDTPTVRGNITEFDAELIKEVPVEEAFFVKNLVMLSPFPLSLDMNALFFVGANETAVVATNGVNLAMELSTWQEAAVAACEVAFTNGNQAIGAEKIEKIFKHSVPQKPRH